MKNRYFQKMKREGIAYRKKGLLNKNGEEKLFSKGESIAYMYWAISERYHSSDIFVDVLPEEKINREMINTYRKAGVKTIVVSPCVQDRFDELQELGCRIAESCKVYRRETELYYGTLEVLNGIRIMLD